ncbi:hypothetical protein F7Q99_01545 [Streptomyces kaniharaensis]|uniref:Uncharacterized protein n=1 Tax=Streptomyces kaniharaensis TaxID=212423 RepID=A0A6N7KKX2_9ACTN|nr:hypothetical protein [Streptomyces kaniharaensis]MQS10997.1 hypothetical protein [Streptomyces kaniharaensis]
MNLIQDSMRQDDDIYDTFTLKALEGIIGNVNAGTRFQIRLAEDVGIMEVMDEHFQDLAAGLRAEHLPSSEADILSSLGFPRVAAQLPGLVCSVKIFSRNRRSFLDEVPVSQQLRDLADRLERARGEHQAAAARSEQEEQPSIRRKRKWWTGLGKVVTGSAISISDMALGIGLLPFEVSPETKSWGALSSAALGIGQVLEGVGAIRGE